MKKILVLLSLVSLITWMVSFLAMDYTPVVNIFLLLSILLFIRSVMTVEMSGNGAMTVESSGIDTGETEKAEYN